MEHMPMGPAQVVLGSSQFGQVIFDATGQAVYTFGPDTTAMSRCYGACAQAWPPVLTHGSPSAGAGIRAGLLGTTKRTDGTTQVTYAGHPLYYFASEAKHVVTCHNMNTNGGLWLAITAAGTAPH
jgi:predicted lipoprotein with Yx(FWY)xxD motif